MENKNFSAVNKKILAIAAHPDDVDFFAGGSINKWLSENAEVGIVIATNGDKGSHDNSLSHEQVANIRRQEQEHVSKELGLIKTWFLDYPDAQLEVTQALKSELVKIIREFKPEVVLTFDPTVIYQEEMPFINHPDHRAIGLASLDAVFPMARDFLTFFEHTSAGLLPHEVNEILLFNSTKPNLFVDITEQMDKKLSTLALHESQMEMKQVEPVVRKLAEISGSKANFKYAEDFYYIRLPAHLT